MRGLCNTKKRFSFCFVRSICFYAEFLQLLNLFASFWGKTGVMILAVVSEISPEKSKIL
jgi:hypothetical protein